MEDLLFYGIPLVAGIVLDSLFGDPYWLPHPIRLFGKAIGFGNRTLNSGKYKRIKGVILVVVLVSLVWMAFYCVEIAASKYINGYYAYTSVMVFFGIANRSLITESLKVEQKLTNEGVEAARNQLSYIVGRDTSQLSENKIRIAVLETLSENLSDGVIAPLFYYALGGIPLMFVYKMVNTMDSMIGYKNEKYKNFGWFAAKFDDALNFIPARITAFLMVAVALSRRGLVYIFRFGHKHASPNAGYPEAALAGILNCRFGGSNVYGGRIIEKPYIGNTEKKITRRDVIKACIINSVVLVVFILCIFVYYNFIAYW